MPSSDCQRRAQLVRGGRDERAPRVLLLAQPRVHRRERARQLADLVGDRLVRHDERAEVALVEAAARVLEQAQPAQQARGEGDPEQQRDAQADERGVEEGRARRRRRPAPM